jgi:hypothetical protein
VLRHVAPLITLVHAIGCAGCESRRPPRVSGAAGSPTGQYVADESTAVRIAEGAWRPIYGATIDDERPYHAELRDSIWVVTGTLHASQGGVAIAHILRRDGRIILLGHTQ